MNMEKTDTANSTRKTFDELPSQAPADVAKLIDAAMKSFPKIHAVLSK